MRKHKEKLRKLYYSELSVQSSVPRLLAQIDEKPKSKGGCCCKSKPKSTTTNIRQHLYNVFGKGQSQSDSERLLPSIQEHSLNRFGPLQFRQSFRSNYETWSEVQELFKKNEILKAVYNSDWSQLPISNTRLLPVYRFTRDMTKAVGLTDEPDTLEADVQRLKFFEGCEEYLLKNKPTGINDSSKVLPAPALSPSPKILTPSLPHSHTRSLSPPKSPLVPPPAFTNKRPDSSPINKEEELIKEINRVKQKLYEVSAQLEESRVVREKLEFRIKEVEEKLKQEEKYLVSEPSCEDEVAYLERLTDIAREKAKRLRVLKALEQKENFIKTALTPKSDIDVKSFPNAFSNMMDFNWFLKNNQHCLIAQDKMQSS